MVIKPPSKKQKKKLSKLLGSQEDVILVTGIGKRYYLLNLFFLFILPLILSYTSFLMVLGFFDLPGYPWVKYLGVFTLLVLILKFPKTGKLIRAKQSFIYALTNRRFLIIRGLFTRKIVTAPLDRITHITIEQSFAQRYIYNTGNLVIITAGFDQREIVIENIEKPVKFKILIEDLTSRIGKDEENLPKLRALSF